MTLSIDWGFPVANIAISFVSVPAFTSVMLGCSFATKGLKVTPAISGKQVF